MITVYLAECNTFSQLFGDKIRDFSIQYVIPNIRLSA